MALATQADVEADLGRPLSASEALRTPSLLSKASALVIGYAGQDFEPAPHPEAVVVVTAGLVARVLESTGAGLVNVEQQNAGPFGVRYATGSTSSSPHLTATDKLMLKPHRLGGGLSSVQFVGERYDVTPDEA